MKVAFIDTVHEVLWNGLKSMGWTCVDMTQMSANEVNINIHNFDGIVIRSRFPMNQEFLKKAINLEFIARSGAGMENIDVAYCKENGIKLFNAPEGNRNAVAEHALGMLLSLFNHLNKADREVRSGIWNREGNRGVELEGKTVGIIGYGNNGSAFAKVLSGFDTRILAHDKYKSGFGTDRVEECELKKIMEEADVISFHIPQNDETIGFFDGSFVEKVRKKFYLINLSRGKIVSTKALLDGLSSGKIRGACLDVLEQEKTSFENLFEPGRQLPAELQELVQSDRVILSPHVGGWTKESYFKLSKVLLDKIQSSYK